MPKSPLRTA